MPTGFFGITLWSNANFADPPPISTRPALLIPIALGDAVLRSPAVVSIATDLDGRIQVFNPGAVRLLGYAANEVTDQLSLSDLCTAWQPGFKALALKASQLVHVECELVFVRKDGSTIPARGSLSTLNGEQGEHIGYLLIATDNSARLEAEAVRAQLEAQVREAQKLEALGTLAAGIAHDFNNILAVTLGNADLALRDCAGNLRAQDSLEEIRKAGSRGRELVHQLLTFMRKKDTELVLVSLAPIVVDTVRLLRATLPGRLAIEVDCQPDVPLIAADSTQIVQVLINLATNAMQAMPVGPGLIRITLSTVRFDGLPADATTVPLTFRNKHPDGAVCLTLSDTGHGMDAETQRRSFDPFFTTKPMGEGTGLGLTIIRGILQTHDGVVTVASQPAEGTRFALYFPIATAQLSASVADSPASTAVEAPRHYPSLRILYIDDDQALVFLVKRLLERRGERVSAYQSAKEALAALRAAPTEFDLVLSDYNMPGLSGLDVARAVRAIRPDLPMAITTGYVDETLEAQAASAGVREVIFKAEAVEQFCDAVQRVGRSTRESS